MSPLPKLTTIHGLAAWKQDLERTRARRRATIVLSSGTCGQASGSLKVREAFERELDRRSLREEVGLEVTGCHGFCELEPNVVIYPQGIFYKKLKPEDAARIIDKTVLGGEVLADIAYHAPDGAVFEKQAEIPFYRLQNRLLTENNFHIDPTRIEDYILLDGYQGLAKALATMTPEQVIDEVKASGLRGRGGAGFPAGKKWELCRASIADKKYVIGNGDEGDPGAYMDRSLLEGNPHAVIEGLTIGGYAIGAAEGFLYVRTEYPLAVKHLQLALAQAREAGLLGKNILGTAFGFDLRVVEGAGAFVSGEETSLMASIEGRRAFPRQRPPYPAESGLWGKPTNINNVETWANVPVVLNQGAARYASIGTEKSKGTKIFSLVGKINNTGLVEVPMGITLRQVIYDIGGGIKDGKAFKAIQTGGPSGGCLPADKLDLAIDYETLTQAGSIMGSGGMIVMDESTCMVDVARYFLNFTQEESCGKCVPCRVGTRQLKDILTRITEGRGEPSDIDDLERLAKTTTSGSLCALGQTAPNPILTTLRYFRDEYEAHIVDKSCPAGVCKALVAYDILPDKCVGCLLCLKNCPVGAISGASKKVHVIDQEKCVKCGACLDVCPPKIRAVAKLTGKKKDELLARAKGAKR